MESKKFNYTHSIIINRPITTVFNASLFYPYFVSTYSFKKATLSKDKIKVEVGLRFLFFETRWKGTGLISEKTIRYRQTSGILVGLISKWVFNEENQQTMVTINIQYKKNIFIGYLSLILLSYIVKNILSDLKGYVLIKNNERFYN